MDKKKTLIISLIAVIAVAIAAGCYFCKGKSGDFSVPSEVKEQDDSSLNIQQVAPLSEDVLRAKVLELVGVANEGREEEALAGYLELEKTNPDDLMLLNNIADVYSDFGNWDKAEEYYKKVLSYHPDYINGYRMLAYLYEYRFSDDEVKIKALMDDGLSKNSNDQSLLSWMIDYYQQKGEDDRALPYSKLLEEQEGKQ